MIILDTNVVSETMKPVPESRMIDWLNRQELSTLHLTTVSLAELRFGIGEHEALAEKVAGLAERVEVLPDRLLLYTDNGEKVLAAVGERGLHPTAALVRRASLEDVFLRLTGRSLVD